MRVVIHRDRLADETFTGRVRQMAVDIGAEALSRRLAAGIGRVDSRPLSASIKCPTLDIVGRQDALTAPDMAREIAEGIGAKLGVIPVSPRRNRPSRSTAPCARRRQNDTASHCVVARGRGEA